MEDKKPQNKRNVNSHTSSETYQTKSSNKQNKRSSLVKRRNTAITLSVISSVILAGIGYEIVTSLKDVPAHPSSQTQAKSPLRILADEDNDIALSSYSPQHADLDFEEEVNIIQQLTKHKNLQSKKIRELKEDLEEARARIVQLKTDILIKGGEKEQFYRDQIDEFNRQLSNFEQENTNLQAEVAVRDKLIESKRLELERLSKIFTDTHEQLQNELSDRESEIENQMTKTDKIFQELREELALTDSEIHTPEDVRDALRETKRRISELESIIESASNSSLEANDQTEEIADQLLASQIELAEARQTIQNLVVEVESQEVKNKILEESVERLLTTQGTVAYAPEHYEIAQRTIIQKQQELESVERRLQKALMDYTNERTRADELSQKLAKLESSPLNQNTTSHIAMASYNQHNSGNYSGVVRQQDRLIRDLQRSLKNVERRNKELEQLLAENKNNVQPYTNSETITKLERELFNSNEKVRELESDLQELILQRNSQYANNDASNNASSNDEEFEALLTERNNLLNQVYEYRSNIQEQQNTINRLQKNLDEQLASNQQQSLHHDNLEINRLKSQVSVLERALAQTEEKLEEAASRSVDSSGNSSGLVEMEEFYETKLTQLAMTNQILEEQLEEAEEYIKLTQQQLRDAQNQVKSQQKFASRVGSSPSSDSNESVKQIAAQLQTEKKLREDLEKELTQLRARFHQIPPQQTSYASRDNENVLKEQVKELQFLYKEEKSRSSQLESQLEALSRMTTNLQNELKAHETSYQQNEVAATPSRLRAKISYLTTRLAQEKSKLMNSEEKLQEMLHTMNEMKERNKHLESQLYYH